MQAIREIIYSFKAKWFDTQAQIDRHFHIRYYQDSNQIEIFDTKSNKLFLKKTNCPVTLGSKDFYLGSTIALYGRHFELMDYSDTFTRELLSKQQQKSVLIVKGELVNHIGTILDLLIRQDFGLSALKMMKIRSEDAQSFYELHEAHQRMESLCESLTEKPVIALELVAGNCVERLRQYTSEMSFPSLPLSIARDDTHFETSVTILEAERYHDFFFVRDHQNTETFENSTCAVVLPHIVKAGLAGRVIEQIQEAPDMQMTALEMFTLDRAEASDFLEVYESVIPYFNESVDQFVSGACIAMQLVGRNIGDVVHKFRVYAGPWDVEMAKHLYPHTIRARFGVDRVRNAVHCTDLPEDGALECEYFFEILSKRRCKT